MAGAKAESHASTLSSHSFQDKKGNMVLIYLVEVTDPSMWNPSLLVTQPCLVFLDKAACIYDVIKQNSLSEQPQSRQVPQQFQEPGNYQMALRNLHIQLWERIQTLDSEETHFFSWT